MILLYLKEAFRYQNFIAHLLEQAEACLNNGGDLVSKITQTHLRSKAKPDEQDEVVELNDGLSYNFNADDIIAFVEYLIKLKVELSTAISQAKSSCELDIDAEIAANTARRQAATVFSRLVADGKNKEYKTQGRAYAFNAEGNQTPYYYDIQVTEEPKYDVPKTAEIARRLANEADTISTAIDKAMVETEVAFAPDFSVNSSFEEAVAEFLKIAH